MEESPVNPQSGGEPARPSDAVPPPAASAPPSSPAAPESGAPPSAPRRPGVFAALRHNLAGGLRLLIPGHVPPERFVRTFDQAALLFILGVLVWAVLDWLHSDNGAALQLDGLFGWTSYLLVGLFAGALIARVQDPQADTRALLVPALSVAPYVLLLLWWLSDIPFLRNRPVLSVLAALAYLEFVGLRTVRAAYVKPRRRTVLIAAAVILAAPFFLDSFGLDTRLWVVDDTQQTQDDDDAATAESLLYGQPAEISAAVGRVAPAVPGKSHMFFVGFAGVGEQAVFKREALYAQQVFADKFGTADRSVELINDVRDRDTYPLATVSGLGQTVKLIADRMDTDEDVLVVMLSSHGSEDGLAVSNGSLPLAQLAPADLQEILDDARIKWRVIIVSACYAGVFLDELKSDTTLIITAADAEHSSFGCDDSRELTWFGEAFLRDSLPKAPSFEAAFRNAAALIRKRETAEHQVHSNPQLFIGARIREKLAGPLSEKASPGPGARGSGTRAALGTIALCPRSQTRVPGAPCRSPS